MQTLTIVSMMIYLRKKVATWVQAARKSKEVENVLWSYGRPTVEKQWQDEGHNREQQKG